MRPPYDMAGAKSRRSGGRVGRQIRGGVSRSLIEITFRRSGRVRARSCGVYCLRREVAGLLGVGLLFRVKGIT